MFSADTTVRPKTTIQYTRECFGDQRLQTRGQERSPTEPQEGTLESNSARIRRHPRSGRAPRTYRRDNRARRPNSWTPSIGGPLPPQPDPCRFSSPTNEKQYPPKAVAADLQ